MVRVKCDYSGTSATLTVQFKRRSDSYTTTWSDSSSTLTFNGTTKSASYSWTGTATSGSWISLASVSGYSISVSGGSYSWSFNRGNSSAVLYGSGTITVPAQATAPSGLSLTNVSVTSNTVTGTVSITNWGGAGDANSRYRNLSVMATNDKPTSARRYQRVYGNTMSSAITVNNSTEYGTMTIQPNTRYWLWWYATNGTLGTGSPDTSTTTIVTLPLDLSSKSATTTGTNSIRVNYTTKADGGYYAKNIQYNIGNGWVTGATVSAAASTSGNFTISGLTSGQSYTINLRVNTSAGSTGSGSVSATTYKIPNEPTTSATNASATSNTITYGTTSFNNPSSGTVVLYCGIAGGVYEEITRKSATGNSTYTHSNLTGNTKYWYKSRANNAGGWTAYSSESTVITRPANPTITINSLGHHAVSLSINSPSQGSAATMTAYYKVDGGSAISAGTISSGGSTTVQLSFEPQTSHTVTAYLSNSSGDSGEATSTFTTKIPFYAPVSGQSKMVKKLYCSVNGEAKKVQHLYASVNGQAKKIF